MFFFELRLGLSAFLLIYEWYILGFLDSYLHYLLEKELSRLSCLPITIEKLHVQMEGGVGFAWIVGLQMKAPPVEEDERWELEHMITVELVEIKFPIFTSLFSYILSFGELAVLDNISVYGLKAFVEGYRNGEDEVSFNVNLIGKRRFTTKDGYFNIEEISINKGLENVVVLEDYFSYHLSADVPSSSLKGTAKRNSGPTNNKCNNFHDYSESNKFYYSAKSKFANVYEKTKHTITESISDRINALHVHLCGPEPLHFPGEFRFICNYLYYDVIEIHMCRALPIQLRHLEQKPLVVQNMSLVEIGIPRIMMQSFNDNNDWKWGLQEFTSKIDSNLNLLPCSFNFSNHSLALFWDNLDLYEDGMDIRIFKYRFERKMLHALCKQNAGNLYFSCYPFNLKLK